MLNWTRSFLLLVLTGILSSALGKPLLTETLDVHQAEEHSEVTLTWIHPYHNATPPKSLYIDLMRMESQKRIYLYDSRLKADVYTDDLFRGRLQCDPQQVGNGRIDVLLTDLRLDDTGTYHYYVRADGKVYLKEWKLIVKAAVAVPQTQEETQKPIDRGRFGLYVSLGLLAIVFGGFCYITSSGFGLSTFISRFK